MADYKKLFTSHMDQKGIKYSISDQNTVKVTFSGDNMKSIDVFVFFDKNGGRSVAFRSWSFATFKEDKLATAYKVCNDLNNQYRWVKFFIDKDGDVIAQIDAVVNEETCGKECMEMVGRMVNISDEVYPSIMKTLWT